MATGLGELFYGVNIKSDMSKLDEIEARLRKLNSAYTLSVNLEFKGTGASFGASLDGMAEKTESTAKRVAASAKDLHDALEKISNNAGNQIKNRDIWNNDAERLARQLERVNGKKINATKESIRESNDEISKAMEMVSNLQQRYSVALREIQSISQNMFGGKTPSFLKDGITSLTEMVEQYLPRLMSNLRGSLGKSTFGQFSEMIDKTGIKLRDLGNKTTGNNKVDLKLDSALKQMESFVLKTDAFNSAFGRVDRVIGNRSGDAKMDLTIAKAYIKELIPDKHSTRDLAARISDMMPPVKVKLDVDTSKAQQFVDMLDRNISGAFKPLLTDLKEAQLQIVALMEKLPKKRTRKSSGGSETPETPETPSSGTGTTGSEQRTNQVSEEQKAVERLRGEYNELFDALKRSKDRKEVMSNVSGDFLSTLDGMRKSNLVTLTGGSIKDIGDASSFIKEFETIQGKIAQIREAIASLPEGDTKNAISKLFEGQVSSSEKAIADILKLLTDYKTKANEIVGGTPLDERKDGWLERLAAGKNTKAKYEELAKLARDTFNAEKTIIDAAGNEIKPFSGPSFQNAFSIPHLDIEAFKNIVAEAQPLIEKEKEVVKYIEQMAAASSQQPLQPVAEGAQQASQAVSNLSNEAKKLIEILSQVKVEGKPAMDELFKTISSKLSLISGAKPSDRSSMRDVIFGDKGFGDVFKDSGAASTLAYNSEKLFELSNKTTDEGLKKVFKDAAEEASVLIGKIDELKNKYSGADSLKTSAQINQFKSDVKSLANEIELSQLKYNQIQGFAAGASFFSSGSNPLTQAKARLQEEIAKLTSLENELNSVKHKRNSPEKTEKINELTQQIEKQKEFIEMSRVMVSELEASSKPGAASSSAVTTSLNEESNAAKNLAENINAVTASLEALKAKGVDISIFKHYSGKVVGAGTGTNDMNPAMLSNGEFVSTAKSTAQFEKWLNLFNAIGGGTHDIEQVKSALQSLNNVFGGNTVIDKALEQIGRSGKISQGTIKRLSEELSKLESSTAASTANKNAEALNNEAAAANKAADSYQNLNKARGGSKGPNKGDDFRDVNRNIQEIDRNIRKLEKGGGEMLEPVIAKWRELRKELAESLGSSADMTRVLKNLSDKKAGLYTEQSDAMNRQAQYDAYLKWEQQLAASREKYRQEEIIANAKASAKARTQREKDLNEAFKSYDSFYSDSARAKRNGTLTEYNSLWARFSKWLDENGATGQAKRQWQEFQENLRMEMITTSRTGQAFVSVMNDIMRRMGAISQGMNLGTIARGAGEQALGQLQGVWNEMVYKLQTLDFRGMKEMLGNPLSIREDIRMIDDLLARSKAAETANERIQKLRDKRNDGADTVVGRTNANALGNVGSVYGTQKYADDMAAMRQYYEQLEIKSKEAKRAIDSSISDVESAQKRLGGIISGLERNGKKADMLKPYVTQLENYKQTLVDAQKSPEDAARAVNNHASAMSDLNKQIDDARTKQVNNNRLVQDEASAQKKLADEIEKVRAAKERFVDNRFTFGKTTKPFDASGIRKSADDYITHLTEIGKKSGKALIDAVNAEAFGANRSSLNNQYTAASRIAASAAREAEKYRRITDEEANAIERAWTAAINKIRSEIQSLVDRSGNREGHGLGHSLLDSRAQVLRNLVANEMGSVTPGDNQSYLNSLERINAGLEERIRLNAKAKAEQDETNKRGRTSAEIEADAQNKLAIAINNVEIALQKARFAQSRQDTAGDRTDSAIQILENRKRELEALSSSASAQEKLAAAKLANSDVKLASTNLALQKQENEVNRIASAWDTNKAAASGYNSQLAQTLKQTFSLDQQFSQLAMTLQNTFSVIGVQQFAQEIIKIGGELEKQQLALAQILGGTDKANAIYGQVADLSMVSPFTVEDLLKNVKQLSAFGIKYDELYDTARRLSDIAAAVGVDFGRISYEYSQLSSMGYLDRRHLRMFSMSGVPLVDKLQEYYSAERGEAVGREEIDKMIFKREVSADVVKKVLWDMTDEGGKFFNMQQIMAESLASKYANLTNAWNLMLGEMAQGAPGDVLKDIATYLTELTNHWQAIAKVGLGSFAIVALNKIAPIAALAGRAMGDLSSKFALSAKEESRLNAQILRTKGTFRELSIAEQQEIAMSGKITTAQLKNAAAEGKLTKEMAAQLYLRKEITGEQLTAISTSVGMTGNDLVGLGAAPGANWKTFKSTIKADFSKAWDRIKTSAAGAGTSIKNFGKSLINTQAISQKFGSASLRSWAMMKLGLSSLASGVRKLGASIISLAINPATIIFAVIGAITSLVSSIRESAERVAEITDALKNKAKDNIEEFNKMIESVGGKIAISAEVVPTLSEEKQRAVIEKLSEYLKDKLPASGAILNDVFKTDDEGNYIKDRVTQIEILRDAIEKAEKANEIFNNIAGIGASAIQKTEWTWYDWHEDIVENAKDYGNAVIKFNQGIAGLTSKRTEIEDALHKAIANDSSISQLLFPNIEDESERAAKAAEMGMESILGRLKQSMTGSKIKNLLKSSGASEEVAKYVGEVFEKFDEPKADLQYNINKFIGYYKDAIKGRKELFDEKGNLKEEAKYAIRIDMEAALSNGSITQEQFDFIMQSAEKEGLIPIKVDFELQKSNNRNDFQRMLIESIGSYPIESGFAIQTSIEQMVDKSKDVASLFENVGKAQKEAKEKIERLSEAYERLRINAANANVPLEEYAKSVSQSNTVTEYEKAINLQSKYNELLVAARNGYSAVQIAASSAVDEIEGLGITEKSEIEGAISSSSTLSGVIENLEKKQSDYKKQLDLVADAYSKIQNKAREGNMSVEEFVNQLGNEKAKETVTLWESIAAAVNATVNALNSIKGPQTKMQSALTNVLDSKRNNVLNSDYQTEFDNINIAINKSSNIGDIANNVQTIHNKYKGILDDYKKGKNDLNSEQLAMYEYLDGILKEIAKTGGFTLEKSSGTGDKTPNPLDDVNKRLQVLRDVRQALERETELLMKGYGDIAGLPLEAAREAAFQKIKSSGMLDDYEGQIEKFVDLEGYAEQIQKLYDEVSKIVVGKDKEDDKKKLLESIMKLLNLDIPYDIANKEAGKITERINKQMEDAGKKWDFFGTLIESGMDASEASAVAGVEKRFISFADELRDKLKTALFRIGVYNIDINDILTMDDKSIENEYGVEVQTIASKLRTELESEAQKVRSTIAEAIKASTGVEGEKESNNWLRDIVLAAIEKLNGSDEVKNKMKEAVNKMFDLKDTDLSLSHLFEDTSYKLTAAIREQYKNNKNWLKKIEKGQFKYKSDGTLDYILVDGKKVSLEKYKEIKSQVESLGNETDKATESFRKFWQYVSGKSVNGQKLKFADVAEGLSQSINTIGSSIGSLQKLQGTLFGTNSGNGIPDFSKILSGVSGIINGIGQISSGDYLSGINAVGDGLSQAAEASYEAAEEERRRQRDNRLSKINISINNLRNAIDDLSEELEKVYGIEKINETYESQIEAEQKRREVLLKALTDEAGYSHSGLFTNKRSIKYSIDLSEENISDVNSLLAKYGLDENITGIDDLLKLSPEAWKLIREYLPDLYKTISTTHDETGEKDLSDELDAYIESADKLAKLQKEFGEKILGFSVDDMRSNFHDAMMDMTSDAEDFADSFTESMMSAFVDTYVLGNEFQEWLEKWYGDLSSVMSNEELDEDEKSAEVARLKQEYSDKEQELLNKRNYIAELLGYTGETSNSLSKSISGITDEQADILAAYINGIRADASQEVSILEQIREHVVNLDGFLTGNYGTGYYGAAARGGFEEEEEISSSAAVEAMMTQLAYYELPTLNVTAEAQLAQLNMIAEHTLAIRDNTAMMAEYMETMSTDIHRAAIGVQPIYVQ